MNAGRIRRFSSWQVASHGIMVFCFTLLALTGLPQKYPDETWARGLILVFGGVERARWLHHVCGTIMAVQLVVHVVELVWLHMVRRYPATMVPNLKDVQDFLQQVRYNLGLALEPPRMDRYTFAEKLEYLALIWGTVLMVGTGLMLLYPIRWAELITGQGVIAAKTAHGGEALLAVLSVLTWHSYFVHLRHFNKSMFSGYLEEELYAEEHPLELEKIRSGEQPIPQPPTVARVVVFLVLAAFLVLGSVWLLWWMRWSPGVM